MAIRYIGIDLHTSSCTLAVLGPTGRRLRCWQVDTDQRALVEAVRSVAGELCVCFEEGTLSDWLYEILEPVASEIQVIQPLKRSGNKNDTVDAWAAAEAMRVASKEVTHVFKAPKRYTGLRKAVRGHLLIQQDVVRVKNRIHACYRSRAIQSVNAEIYDSELRVEWLKKLAPAQRQLTELLCVELDGLLEARAQAEHWLLEEAEKVPAVRLLCTAPAISLIRASQIVAIVLSPHRFRTRSQFWAYCGLGIVMRSSSDWQRAPSGRWERTQVAQLRGLNHNKNPVLKNVFKGAAITLLHMPTHPLYASYHRALEAGQKPNLARLTLARRIAAAVLAMWKSNTEYDTNKQQAVP